MQSRGKENNSYEIAVNVQMYFTLNVCYMMLYDDKYAENGFLLLTGNLHANNN